MTVKHLRLLIISPTIPPDGEEGPHKLAIPDYLAKTSNLDIVYCKGAPRQIWDAAGCAEVDPLIREKATWAEAQGYDAVIVQCMLDPAVNALKHTLSIPVVGTGEASEAAATLIGNRSARIYPGRIPVYELDTDPEKTFEALLIAAQREIVRGADTLIFACAHLDSYSERLQASVSVPVLPCIQIAIRSAEMLAVFGLRSGRSSHPVAKLKWLARKLSQRSKRLSRILRF